MTAEQLVRLQELARRQAWVICAQRARAAPGYQAWLDERRRGPARLRAAVEALLRARGAAVRVGIMEATCASRRQVVAALAVLARQGRVRSRRVSRVGGGYYLVWELVVRGA